MAVKSEMKASIQFSWAILTAAGASERPMQMMTGPMTTGGNRRSISRRPCHLMSADMTK